jgi:hypothetical protein
MLGGCCCWKHFEVEAFLKAFSFAAVCCFKFRAFSWTLRGRFEPLAKAPEVA